MFFNQLASCAISKANVKAETTEKFTMPRSCARTGGCCDVTGTLRQSSLTSPARVIHVARLQWDASALFTRVQSVNRRKRRSRSLLVSLGRVTRRLMMTVSLLACGNRARSSGPKRLSVTRSRQPSGTIKEELSFNRVDAGYSQRTSVASARGTSLARGCVYLLNLFFFSLAR